MCNFGRVLFDRQQALDKHITHMKKNIVRSIVLLLSAAALAGCAGVNKLIKSKDYEAMYRKGLEMYDKGKFENARVLMEEVAPYFSGTVQEDSVIYYWGASHYKRGEFSSSEVIFDRFRRQYGRSAFIEDVEYMYAMAFYFLSPEPNRDQTETMRAINAINEYLQHYPNSIRKQLCLVRIDELQGKLYDKSYLNARTYYKIGRYKSAVVALRNALAEYPETPHREEILYLTARSSYELATHSISILQRDRYLDMMDTYYTFVAEFPSSKYRKEVDRMHAEARSFLDRHPSDVAVPVEEGRSLPDPKMLQQI